MKRLFTYVFEKDEDGYYIADVPELPGCHTQARSLDELENRIREAIAVYLRAYSSALGNFTASKSLK